MTLDVLLSCDKGLHFPERIYYWPLLEAYYAHCAICRSDYKIKEEEK